MIDASVFLNAFNPGEAGHETSKEMLTRLQANGVPLIAPTLLLPEITAAIRRGQDNPNLARQFATALTHLPHLTLVPLDQLLAQQAWTLLPFTACAAVIVCMQPSPSDLPALWSRLTGSNTIVWQPR